MGQFFEFANRTRRSKNRHGIPQNNNATWYPKFDYADLRTVIEVFETVIHLNGWLYSDDVVAIGDNGAIIKYQHVKQIYSRRVPLTRKSAL
jgi:hypothetical protein